jgi:pimeloyl-ACP methyl ester carboxylesterase
MRRILTISVLAVLLASCAGAGDNADSTTSPPPAAAQTAATGELNASFDTGGHKLHLRCQGKGSSGSPTVVYLHGLGGDGSDVESINTLLAGQVRVCTYDRVNVGRSDRVTGRHTGADSVNDLHALLGNGRRPRAIPAGRLLVPWSAGHHVRRHLPRPGHGHGEP